MILVNTDGTRVNITQKIESIKTISELLNGIIEPIALGEWWVFKLRDIRTDLNNDITKIINIPTYGPCILAKEDELPKYFFYPKEWFKKKENDDIYEDVLNKKSDSLYNIKEDDDTNDIELSALNDLYYNLFPVDKNVDYKLLDKEINKKLKKDPEYLSASTYQIEMMDKMLEVFIEEEEYEKCNNIYNLKKYILNKLKELKK